MKKSFLPVPLITAFLFAGLQSFSQSAPGDFAGNVHSSRSIYLSWDADSNAVSYKVYTCQGTFVKASNRTACLIQNLSPNTAYSFKVKATYRDSSESNFTRCINVATPELRQTNPFSRGLERLADLKFPTP